MMAITYTGKRRGAYRGAGRSHTGGTRKAA